jgi:hypothetical protein
MAEVIDIEMLPKPQDIFEAYPAPNHLLSPYQSDPSLLVGVGVELLLVPQLQHDHPHCAASYFSTTESNCELTSLDNIIIPPASTCRQLEQNFRDALACKAQSVRHPVMPDLFLPLNTVHLWKYANLFNGHHAFWNSKLSWIRTISTSEHWSSTFRDSVIHALKQAPFYDGPLSSTSYHHLSSIMLSTNWLTGDSLDAALDVIRGDTSLPLKNAPSVILGTKLWEGIWAKEMQESASAKIIGFQIRTGIIERILLPVNIGNIHWMFGEIQVKEGTIRFGDSSPSTTKSYYTNMVKRLTCWLSRYCPDRPAQSWRIEKAGLEVFSQMDGFSCGIATANGIHSRLLPSMKIWHARKPGALRAYYLYRCFQADRRFEVCRP